MQYKPVHGKIEHGMFDITGERIDIFSSTEKFVYRLHFNEELLELIDSPRLVLVVLKHPAQRHSTS